MTDKMINQIRSELYNAFVRCGETDHAILDEKVEGELETLLCFVAGSDPSVIHTDNGDLVGYLVDIAVTSGDAENEILALQMIVTKDAIRYVLNSYVAVKPDDWEDGDDIQIQNETNRLVDLEEIDFKIFNI